MPGAATSPGPSGHGDVACRDAAPAIGGRGCEPDGLLCHRADSDAGVTGWSHRRGRWRRSFTGRRASVRPDRSHAGTQRPTVRWRDPGARCDPRCAVRPEVCWIRWRVACVTGAEAPPPGRRSWTIRRCPQRTSPTTSSRYTAASPVTAAVLVVRGASEQCQAVGSVSALSPCRGAWTDSSGQQRHGSDIGRTSAVRADDRPTPGLHGRVDPSRPSIIMIVLPLGTRRHPATAPIARTSSMRPVIFPADRTSRRWDPIEQSRPVCRRRYRAGPNR